MILRSSKTPLLTAGFSLLVGVLIGWQNYSDPENSKSVIVSIVVYFMSAVCIVVSAVMIIVYQAKLIVHSGIITLTGTMGWTVEFKDIKSIKESYDCDGDFAGVEISKGNAKIVRIPTWLCDKSNAVAVIAIFTDNKPNE